MGLSRQGTPRNCWALLGPSRRAKVLAEPGPEADLVAAEPPPPLKVPRRRAKSRLSGSNRLGVESTRSRTCYITAWRIRTRQNATCWLSGSNITGNPKNLEINTLESTARHPPPTHRHHHLQTSWLRYDHRHSSSADNCARTKQVQFLACVHVSAGIASLSERA